MALFQTMRKPGATGGCAVASAVTLPGCVAAPLCSCPFTSGLGAAHLQACRPCPPAPAAVHAMLYAMWFPPLNARGIPVPGETIMTLGAVNIADTWTDIGRSALGRWVAKQAVA